MRQFLLLSCAFFCLNGVFGQDTARVEKHLDLKEVRYDKHFDLHYRQQLNLIQRVYPLAVYAKMIIDSLDAEIEAADGRRAKKKLAKNQKEDLKDDFTFLLKDLYKGEGAMLFKLIHRETDMTVTEILTKYKNGLYAKSVKATFSMYGHDTSSTFDADGDDWITELVIQDILSGRTPFNWEIKDVSKQDYKQNMKDYRDYRRNLRKKSK